MASSSQAGIRIWSRILEQREGIGACNRRSDRVRAAVLEEASSCNEDRNWEHRGGACRSPGREDGG